MKNLFLFLTIFFLALQSCAPAKLLQQPLKLQAGYSVLLRQKTDTETIMEMFGKEEAQRSKNTAEYEYHVTEALPDGRLKWQMTITRYIIENTDVRGGLIEYDTDDPLRDTSDVKKKLYDKMVGVPMYMTTKADGEILDFSGADALFDRVLELFKDKPEMAPFAQTIKNTYGDSAMIETVRNMWGNMPPKPVRVGSKWTANRDLPGIISLSMEYTYVLKSRDATKAIVAIKSKTKPRPGKISEMDLGVVKIIYDLKGNGSGTMQLSQPDGMLMGSIHTIKMDGIMHMSGEKIPKMDVPLSVKTIVTTEKIR